VPAFEAVRYGRALVLASTVEDLVITRFDDGAEVWARPRDDASYAATAAELGYETPARMNAEHDEIHCQIAQMLGLGVSPTLWAVAHGSGVDEALSGLEEDAALALARFKNACRRAGLLP